MGVLWTCVAVAIALLTFILIGMWIISSRKAKPRPLSWVDDSRAVAIGVENPTDFSGMHFAAHHAPFFQFALRNNLSWTIWFTLGVYLPDRAVDLKTLPPVIVCVPRDASGFTPGPKVGFNHRGEMTGQIRAEYNSTIERRQSTNKSILYEIRPLDITTEVESGRPMARYEFRCNTRSPNTTSAGLASTHFELDYQPAHAQIAGITPGLGQLWPSPQLGQFRYSPLGIQYKPYFDTYNRSDKVALHQDKLAPKPDYIDGNVCKWFIPPHVSFAIRGTATRASMALIEGLRGWLIGALGAGFIAALVAMYVTSH